MFAVCALGNYYQHGLPPACPGEQEGPLQGSGLEDVCHCPKDTQMTPGILKCVWRRCPHSADMAGLTSPAGHLQAMLANATTYSLAVSISLLSPACCLYICEIQLGYLPLQPPCLLQSSPSSQMPLFHPRVSVYLAAITQ